MIDDDEIDALRGIAERIRQQAEFTSYGYPCVDDPREFTPDADVCSEEEIAAHAAACDAWNAGDKVARPPTHVPFEGGHITQAPWGIGVSTLVDDELMKLAQDLDDAIDRIRQVST
jgi:hypothetical protein